MNFKSLFGKKGEPAAETPKNDSLPAKKVLVVDDNAVIRETFRKLLSPYYEVLLAEDGSEAASAARQQKPDLILLDLSFPPEPSSGPLADGFDVVKWIRQILKITTIPIVIISDTAPDKYKDRFDEGEIAAFYKKPLKKNELLAAVRSAMGESN